MLNRWSAEATLRFVKIYLKNECLWNPKDPDYKSKVKREAAYERLFKEARVFIKDLDDILDVKTKIKNLRTTYQDEVKKILRKSTDPDNIYQPSLYWFAEMDKHLKDISFRKTASAGPLIIPKSSSSDHDTWNAEDSNIHQDDSSDGSKHEDSFLNDPDFIANPCSDNEDIKYNSTRLSQRLRGVKTEQKAAKSRKRSHESSESLDFSLTADVEEEDEFDLFGRYVAAQLRSISLNSAIKMKTNIHKMLTKARILEL